MDRRKRQEVDRAKAEELAEERGRLEQWRARLEEGGRMGEEGGGSMLHSQNDVRIAPDD